MQHVADVVEPDSRVGDVQGAGRRDDEVVQEHRAQLAQAHAVDRRASLRVERSHRVDVGHPQRVSRERHALGRVEDRSRASPLDELQVLDRSIRLDPADETVVVLGQRAAIDVGDEVDVLRGVVQHGFRREESGDGEDLRRRRWRRGGRRRGARRRRGDD